MASPFPGMDPFLEDDNRWQAFQPLLVHSLYQMLLPGLLDRYRARVGEREYASEEALFTSIVREEHKEPFIEVRQRSDGRLITLIEMISPANKITSEGRRVYIERRDEVKRMNANLVEIDLVLQGQTLIDCAKDARPDLGLRRRGDSLDASRPLRNLLRDAAQSLAAFPSALGIGRPRHGARFASCRREGVRSGRFLQGDRLHARPSHAFER